MPLVTDPAENLKKEARATGSLIPDPVNPFVKGTTIAGKEAEDYRQVSDKYGDFNFTQITPMEVQDTGNNSNNELLSALAIVAVIIICLTLLLKTKQSKTKQQYHFLQLFC
jgi:hypothetical protein